MKAQAVNTHSLSVKWPTATENYFSLCDVYELLKVNVFLPHIVFS